MCRGGSDENVPTSCVGIYMTTTIYGNGAWNGGFRFIMETIWKAISMIVR